jgi:acetyl-CoA synthetase
MSMNNDTPNPSAQAFRAARDHLLTHRTGQAALGAHFRWPRLTQFNWALDHFERLAREQPDAPALWIVNEARRAEAQLRADGGAPARWPTGCAGWACGAATACC